jgi:hypothetical protein
MHFGEVHSLQSKKFSIVFINLLGTTHRLLGSTGSYGIPVFMKTEKPSLFKKNINTNFENKNYIFKKQINVVT